MKYTDVDWEDFNSHKEDLEIEGEEWKTSRTINEKMGSGSLFEVSNYGRVRRSDTKFVYTISDNGIESGYLNFETNGVKGEMVNFDFSIGKPDSEYVEVAHSSTVDKQDLITFLEKSLEMLKREV